jgi:hypothetical protein
VADDQSEVLLTAVYQEVHGNMTNTYVRLKGLEPGSLYKEVSTGQLYPADALMEAGMPLPMPKEECCIYIPFDKRILVFFGNLIFLISEVYECPVNRGA